jgi:tyrocidine synthetase III
MNEAVILVKDAETGNSDSKYLAAYIVTDRELNVTELREYLLKELPAYMVPSTFVKVDQIPLTSNRKVDRKPLESYDLGTTLSN